MKLPLLVSAYGFLLGLGGLLWLAVPGHLSLYGVTPDPFAMILTRYGGALSLGIAAIAWLSRNAGPSEARKGVVAGLTVTNALAAVACLMGALSGELNALAWLPTAAFGVFAVLFAGALRAERAMGVTAA